MNPRVTISTKMSSEVAQKMKVWLTSAGSNRPKLKAPCHTTSATESASTSVPMPNNRLFFMRIQPCLQLYVRAEAHLGAGAKRRRSARAQRSDRAFTTLTPSLNPTPARSGATSLHPPRRGGLLLHHDGVEELGRFRQPFL